MSSVSHPLIREGALEYREYQVNIAREAYGKNALVILPTALGKTAIAMILAAEVLYRQRSRKVLILAPTRPLVLQHAQNFMKTLNLPESSFAALTGRIEPAERARIWAGKARVIFSTPEVVRNDIQSLGLSLKDFGLVVFDEAHRAVKDYAYTFVARTYVNESEYPMILGLTASPGASQERIMEVCRNLFIEKIIYRDENDPDVRPYVHSVELEYVRVKLPESYERIKSILKRILDRRLAWLYQNGLLEMTPSEVRRKDLIELGERLRSMLDESPERRGIIFQAIANQSAALTVFHMMELLETQGISTLREFLEKWDEEEDEKRFRRILSSDEDFLRLKLEVQSVNEEHPKLGVLLDLVRKQISENPSSRMIIFTQFRNTASLLVERLNGIPGIRAARFVGQASRKEDRGLKQEEQVRLLRSLESGEINALIATSIGEEGLDIPSVDLVIFYEPIPSEIRFIQRKGRTGRRGPGRVIILTTQSSLDSAYLYSSLRKVRRMKAIVSSLNSVLQPIFRQLPSPPEDPMKEEELGAAGTAERPKELGPDQIKKAVYDQILASQEGLTAEEIASRLGGAADDLSVRAALRELEREQLVFRRHDGKYVTFSAIRGRLGEVHRVEIVKVGPSYAIARIDDRWYARLEPSEYNGPRDLIRKGTSFEALIDFYKLEGVTHIIVKDVVRRLQG
ncbi:MAG: helicase-related protein [Nitrososphaeria archaeon]